MDIFTRVLVDEDRNDCIYVEKGATPNLIYINDVWDLFLNETEGGLIGAFVNNKLEGMGKITRLFKNIAWLETLRVHPSFQRKGLGQAIYDAYLKEAEAMNIEKLGMYTEMYNLASKALAERNGFSVKAHMTELTMDVKQEKLSKFSFQQVSEEKGEETLSPYYKDIGPFLVINRTFFPVEEGLGAHVAKNGWLYKDKDDTVLVAGYRFQPEKALHIPFISGDRKEALVFGHYLACQTKSKKLSTLQVMDSLRICEYKKDGFSIDGSYMTLWREF